MQNGRGNVRQPNVGHWFKEGLRYSEQKGVTINWMGNEPMDVIANKLVVKADWYPHGLSKAHKGTFECRILGTGGKSF